MSYKLETCAYVRFVIHVLNEGSVFNDVHDLFNFSISKYDFNSCKGIRIMSETYGADGVPTSPNV